MKKTVCCLISIIFIMLSISGALATTYDGLVSTIFQDRIDFMKSRLGINSELESSMVFYYDKIGSNSVGEGTEIYTSGLDEEIWIKAENNRIVEIQYYTPAAYPWQNSISDIKQVARGLGLTSVVYSSEILFGGTHESATDISNKVMNGIVVNPIDIIETDNMKVDYHGDIMYALFPEHESQRWYYRMTRK